MKLLTQGQIEMFPGDENLAYLVNIEDYDAELGLKIKSEDGEMCIRDSSTRGPVKLKYL